MPLPPGRPVDRPHPGAGDRGNTIVSPRPESSSPAPARCSSTTTTSPGATSSGQRRGSLQGHGVGTVISGPGVQVSRRPGRRRCQPCRPPTLAWVTHTHVTFLSYLQFHRSRRCGSASHPGPARLAWSHGIGCPHTVLDTRAGRTWRGRRIAQVPNTGSARRRASIGRHRPGEPARAPIPERMPCPSGLPSGVRRCRLAAGTRGGVRRCQAAAGTRGRRWPWQGRRRESPTPSARQAGA